MDYTDDELDLLDAIENNDLKTVKFDNEIIKKMAKQTRINNNEKKQISINLKKTDLDIIKQRAANIGMSYQNIIQALVHNYSTGKLKLQI